MSLPKISIITPSFNQGKFIEQTILSILEQDYPNMEYFVMDGGSTDETVDVLKKYTDRITHWVSEKDNGQSHAFNKGFKMATGDIIGTVNSDDILIPGALESVADRFVRNKEINWFTGGCVLFGPGKTSDIFDIRIPQKKVGWLLRWAISHPSTFMRKEMLEKHGYYDESFYFAMDYEYWMRLSSGGEICHYNPRTLSAFRYHSSSKTVSEQNRRWADVERITQMYLPKFSPQEQRYVKFMQRRNLGVDTFNTADYLFANGAKEEAIELWKSAFDKFPEARMSLTRFKTAARMGVKR